MSWPKAFRFRRNRKRLSGSDKAAARSATELENAYDRMHEIDTLVARFRMLEQHYGSDQGRLEAIIEAAFFFALEDGETCPICGADPKHHRPKFACDGNIDKIVEAAKAETAELQSRAAELKQTMDGLAEERDELAKRAREILPELQTVQRDINREVPSVQTVRSATNRIIERKVGVQKSLDLVRRRENFQGQRSQLGVVPGYDSTTMVAEQSLNGAVLNEFCLVVESELKAWDFQARIGCSSSFRSGTSPSPASLAVQTERVSARCYMAHSASA